MVFEHSLADTLAGYSAALSQAAYMAVPQAGLVALGDRDRADLLHRLSTNAVLGLEPGQGTRTVLTNHNGRIIDLLTVCARPDELVLISSPTQGQALAKLLRKNIFFNDKVAVADRSAATCQYLLYGPRAAEVLRALGADDPGDLALFASREVSLHGQAALLVRDLPIGEAGFRLIVDSALEAEIASALEAAGAEALSQEAYEVLRVEQGYPSFGHELSLEYIPLETGLHDAISFKKGCYVGQEIIARMESRNRLAKSLRGLKLNTAATAPAKLDVGGKESGDLTSAVLSPRFGPIALAYVRTAHSQPGSEVGIAGSEVRAEVVELPFC